jgi:hypothetical protein
MNYTLLLTAVNLGLLCLVIWLLVLLYKRLCR